MQISLEKTTWTIGAPLTNGVGGFGSVLHASNAETPNAVAKFVKRVPGATREMLIGEQLSALETDNVVPILDSGVYEDTFVLVMPRADMSLAERLKMAEPVELAEGLQILTDIAQALARLDGHIVHRDLKPQNVLLLNGKWRLADFGISRYADAATAASDETRKGSLTFEYAAPEQWLFKHATAAADVYAFGVIAYEVFAGELPFCGPSEGDYRQQHLFQVPPPLTSGTPRLRNIISECLDKAPEIRPAAAALLARLEKAGVSPALQGEQKLAAVNAQVVASQAQANAEQRVLEDQAITRGTLFRSAGRMFESISQPLLESVTENAPTARIQEGLGSGASLFVATLLGAKLGLSRPKQENVWEGGPFDVVATAVISLQRQQRDSDGWLGRSHSLWFCDPQTKGQYGWFEMSFMETFFGLGGGRRELEPFSLEPRLAVNIFSSVIGGGQLAWPITEVDRDDPSEFINRWLGWFADAGLGVLTRPTRMPERNTGSWRKS